MSNGLLEMLKELAKDNPDLQKKIAASFGFDKAQEAREQIKVLGDQLSKDGFRQSHIMYGLSVNLALIAYIGQWGDRAKARDKIAAAIDSAMEGIDSGARSNGLYETLKEYERAENGGDKNGAKRLREELINSDRKFGFEF
jgi:hypothetical protein